MAINLLDPQVDLELKHLEKTSLKTIKKMQKKESQKRREWSEFNSSKSAMNRTLLRCSRQ